LTQTSEASSKSEADFPSSEEYLDKEASNSVKKGGKVMIVITPEDLVDCTSKVSTRHNVGVQPQASLLVAICNKAGVDLNNVAVYKTTVHRKRNKKIESIKIT